MIQRASNRLIKHGVAAMIVALLAGFALIFSMIGGISLSPLPVFFEWSIPGDPAGWRAVHVGTLMNGLMAILLGVAITRYRLGETTSAVVSWGVVIAVWGNFLFYLFGMFAPNHALTVGDNRLGESNLASLIAFFPALLGAITLLVALVVLLAARAVDE